MDIKSGPISTGISHTTHDPPSLPLIPVVVGQATTLRAPPLGTKAQAGFTPPVSIPSFVLPIEPMQKGLQLAYG